MIVYFDTSALVPLLVEEASSAACGDLWDGADAITTTRLAYIEAVAALAMAARVSRITEKQAMLGRSVLDDLWPVVAVIELGEGLMLEAARLAAVHGLRGYDATHCAAAVSASDAELVAASGDLELLAAWRAEGIAVRDTSV